MKNVAIILRRAELLGAIAVGVELKRVKQHIKDARIEKHEPVTDEYTRVMSSLACLQNDVRYKTRVANLAYAYQRGRKYFQVEKKTNMPKWLFENHFAKAIAEAAHQRPEKILEWLKEGTSG